MVKPGYKLTEIGEIPEDWELVRLSNLSNGGFQNGVFYEVSRKGNGVRIINVGDLYGKSPINYYTLHKFDATDEEISRFSINSGDLFFTRSSIVPSGIAYCNWYKGINSSENVVFDSHVIRFKTNTYIVNPMFLYLQCIGNASRNYFISNAKTAIMTTIDQEVLGMCPIIVAPLWEQERITEVFSDVDGLIASLEKMIAKKKAIKQGAMQRLLTGKTRLPGFSGEWKQELLGNAITLYNGYAFKSSEYAKSGKYPVITIANVHRGKMVMDTYNTIDNLPSDLQDYQKLVKGDCLISMTGNVGRVCLVNRGNCLLNQRVGKIIPNGLYDSKFIYWILNSDDFLETMVELAKGGAQPNISKKDILGYEFSVPIDKNEQQYITKVIDDITYEIESLSQKLAKTRQLKQGMMQQLLTGKIRLLDSH